MSARRWLSRHLWPHDAATVARVKALRDDMLGEMAASWKDPEENTYDAGADDQLATDVRRLRLALAGDPRSKSFRPESGGAS